MEWVRQVSRMIVVRKLYNILFGKSERKRPQVKLRLRWVYSFKMCRTNTMEQSSSREGNSYSAIKKFPAYFATRKIITAFTKARKLFLS
jgi:hypothetical protein